MPFEQYLRADDQDINSTTTDHQNNNYPQPYSNFHDHRLRYQDYSFHHGDGRPHCPEPPSQYDVQHYHPHAVQFQIPQLMLNGPPILAPGGGAEVLPAGLLDSPNSLASSWFTNNGFSPALISKQDSAHLTTSDTYNAYDAFRATGSHYSPPDFSSPFTAHANPQEQPPPQIEVPALYTSDLSHAPPVITSPSSLPSSNVAQHVFPNALIPHPIPPFPITPPSAVGLPVYSTSGFDIISILSRITNRPNPTVHLGPVDFSCSFAIADVRRHDCPIVYASPTFYRLTGYSEDEVLGRNCRFLQSPMGHVAKGETRRFVSPEAVSYMRKSLSSFKECQTSLINYRKGGQAFINLVTIIPLRGGVHNLPEEADEVVYFVGFQVDLTEQPSRILEKLRDGSYCTNYSTWGMSGIPGDLGLPGLGQGLGQALGQLQQAQNVANIGVRGGKHGPVMSIVVSKELRSLIADTTFTDSVPISTGTNISGTTGTAEQGGNSTTTLAALATSAASGGVASSSATNQNLAASGCSTAGSMPVPLSPSLSLLLLELLPDFLLVLSLKGSFLYVAPSVRLVLGYEPHELVGRSISDVCHPADLVPLMRELKEGSVSGMSTLGGEGGTATGMGSNVHPKPVDLLFRALPKTSTFSPFTQEPSSTEHGDPQTQAQSTSSDPSSSWNSHPNGSSGLASMTDPSLRSTSPPPYVWLECRGRLHVEPGKGRKAIILSGRARWMPVVRWGGVGKAGSIGSLRGQGAQSQGGSSMGAGSISISIDTPSSNGGFNPQSTDPHEFWALLSSQGTLLVASASVRDVLGWGVGEIIGRSIWEMVGGGGNGVKEQIEAELATLDAPDASNTDDPPPMIVTTSLVHKDARFIPVRLVFYRTPWSHTHSRIRTQTSCTSPCVAISTPLIHPLNNPLCPLVCQVTVLPDADHQHDVDAGLCGAPPVSVQMDADGSSTVIHPPRISLFEELETSRGSSWQYELQQLKFANQRLHEELHALEGASVSAGAGAATSTTEVNSGSGLGSASLSLPKSPSTSSLPLLSSSSAFVPISVSYPRTQSQQLHYTSPMHSTRPISHSSSSQSSLHSQHPPSSDWSSLTGANGHAPNPLKRAWQSDDGPTT
ncbi:hypothetical protein BDN67DRAFT_980355 [Paxillus ammoniavirescens]|nr:hypothetical protein BDN67DRAFT_980355 [Paxillus ammoniavirescens]